MLEKELNNARLILENILRAYSKQLNECIERKDKDVVMIAFLADKRASLKLALKALE